MPSLFVIRGNDQGVRFELSDPTAGIGRDPSNLIQLHDTEVSRRHAELRSDGRGYVLSDLGSSNGTFVNGQRVERHELTSGDQVQLGGTLMLYTGVSSESSADLLRTIDLADAQGSGDSSRIVRSISQAEGSQLFSFEQQASESPWLARARSNLQVMYRTALAVSHTLDIDQLLHRIMQLIFEVEADRGCVMFVDPTKKPTPKYGSSHGSCPADRITISQTIIDT